MPPSLSGRRCTGDERAHSRPNHPNLINVQCGIIERQAIHRGSFASVTDLNRRIRASINGWNDRCHPFLAATAFIAARGES